MTTEPLAGPAMRDRIARLRAALDASPAPERPEGLDELAGPAEPEHDDGDDA